ncbi:MAG: tRNA (cytidine(34)-2'-O)-methyltransferase [Leptolyngbya sp. Prado105]|jgi:tRNA (cytidine/uridine-2'-O-)-methyltransferase|nr:tRNA (cytidine(34)-2'-O)-methyltransferase [Leptolyngbya sp. Prado105]
MPKVVLVHPQIPPNTGNIARTCAATETELHLVAPLGFEISDRYLKRAGLDYWEFVKLTVHDSIVDFQTYSHAQGGRWIGFSAKATQNFTQIQYQENDWLLFGCETAGLPDDVMQSCPILAYIPITQPRVRGFNLSVSAALGLFEARRQLGYLG